MREFEEQGGIAFLIIIFFTEDELYYLHFPSGRILGADAAGRTKEFYI